ncbi:MAG: polyprenyl synthetase family protein [Candidatus Dormibacteria bacterium]
MPSELTDPEFDQAEFERRLGASALQGSGPRLHRSLDHVLAAGGKRLRPLLVFRFGAMLGADPGRLMPLAVATEMLHTATLVHDDVIDQAVSRRGRPALHLVAGVGVALLVGDLYLARCGMHLAEVGDPRATAELFGALETIVRGELEQRHHVFDLGQDRDAYLRTIERKTASLVEAACAAAALVAGASPVEVAAARRYGHHLGIAFQVVEDILDYTATADDLGKPAGNDIREGNITLPLILGIEADPGLAGRVQSAREAGAFDAVVEAVRKSGSLATCDDLAAEHSRLAVDALAPFPGGATRDALAALAMGLRSRRH